MNVCCVFLAFGGCRLPAKLRPVIIPTGGEAPCVLARSAVKASRSCWRSQRLLLRQFLLASPVTIPHWHEQNLARSLRVLGLFSRASVWKSGHEKPPPEHTQSLDSGRAHFQVLALHHGSSTPAPSRYVPTHQQSCRNT